MILTCYQFAKIIATERLEVMELLKECYDKAYKMLSENRDVLDKIAEFLFEKETITGKEFMKIYREVKGLPETDEDSDAKKDCDSKEEKASFDVVIGEKIISNISIPLLGEHQAKNCALALAVCMDIFENENLLKEKEKLEKKNLLEEYKSGN